MVGGALLLAAVTWRVGAGGPDSRRASLPAHPAPVRWGDQSRQAVALMFNVDWGEECIPTLLGILADQGSTGKGVRVTFFVTGTWAERFPELVSDMAAGGHAVATHGYSHLHPAQLDADGLTRHIQEGARVLTEVLGRPPAPLYAPPYGEAPSKVVAAASSLGFHTVLWSIDSVDWQRPPAVEIVHRVNSKLRPGALVLLHPTCPTLEALPAILSHIRAAGWKALTVEELLPQP